MKRVLILLVVLTLILSGCNSQVSEIKQDTPQETQSGGVMTIGEPPMDINWISPGKVEVGNFYPGARAEWTMLVHNGINEKTEQFKVTTYAEEDSITLPLKAKVWNGDTENITITSDMVATETIEVDTGAGKDSVEALLREKVADGRIENISVISNLGNDKPIIASYDSIADRLVVRGLIESASRKLVFIYYLEVPTASVYDCEAGKVTIVGLLASSTRVLTIEYVPESTQYTVTYRYPDNVGEGFAKPTDDVQDWVIIADTTPVLAPQETREILVVLEMPKDGVMPAPKWEFWISVKDTSQTGMVAIELASRWLIRMRDG